METLDFYDFLLPTLFFVCFYSSRFSFSLMREKVRAPRNGNQQRQRERERNGWLVGSRRRRRGALSPTYYN